MVSSSLPVPNEGSLQLTAKPSSESHATAVPHSTAEAQHAASTAASSQQEASADAAVDRPVNVSREGQVAVLTSLQPAHGNQGLSTFLAAYGSDSESDVS